VRIGRRFVNGARRAGRVRFYENANATVRNFEFTNVFRFRGPAEDNLVKNQIPSIQIIYVVDVGENAHRHNTRRARVI